MQRVATLRSVFFVCSKDVNRAPDVRFERAEPQRFLPQTGGFAPPPRTHRPLDFTECPYFTKGFRWIEEMFSAARIARNWNDLGES
jgi:hypothetical protein